MNQINLPTVICQLLVWIWIVSGVEKRVKILIGDWINLIFCDGFVVMSLNFLIHGFTLTVGKLI